MKKILLFVTILLTSEIFAIPRFALMRGNQCKDCHANPTGGLIRNKDGWRYGKNNLQMFRSPKTESSPFINENVSFGFDFRYQYIYSQEINKSDFQKMAGGIYSNIALSEEINFLTYYDLIRGYYNAYGVLNILPLEGYLKIGTFSPNFGVRIDDHTAYTRNGDAGLLGSTSQDGFLFEAGYSQTGIEMGLYPTTFSFITFSAGQSQFTFSQEPTYIGRIELISSVNDLNFLLGGSFGAFTQFKERSNLTSIFGGFGFSNFSLLSEMLIAQDYFGKDIKSRALMVESSFRFRRGVDLVVRYDRIVPDVNQIDKYFSHLILGFDLFPNSFIEVKPQFRFYLENPEVKRNNSFILQFHFWY